MYNRTWTNELVKEKLTRQPHSKHNECKVKKFSGRMTQIYIFTLINGKNNSNKYLNKYLR